MSYEIKKSKEKVNHHRKKYPFEDMEVGDYIEPENIKGAYGSSLYWSKNHTQGKTKFVVRETKLIRVK